MVKNWQEMLKSEILCSFGKLNIESKTILLLAGQSLAGKTITCLHLVDSAIKNNIKIVYIDSEKKSILKRPHPNLFKYFYEKNKKAYDSNFIYIDNFKEDNIFKELDKIKPKIIVIDSLYQPFLEKYSEPRTRAKEIKDFLTNLRSYIWKNNLGCIITSPTGRVVEPSTKEETLDHILGGEGIKYLSDIKVLIKFVSADDKDSETSDKRLFIIDRQLKICFRIKYGGHLVPVE